MKNKLYLEEGEMVCSKCNGRGHLRRIRARSICRKCQGEGKLNWIENIVGKKLPERIPTQKAIKAYINAKSKNQKGLLYDTTS